jgi:uncharacterized BrkB/YihY/UPF0761 family membrane protein
MIREILRHVLKRYDRINGPLLAKGLGFSLILGLLPLVFIALSAGAYLVNITPELYGELLEGLSDFIPADILENYLSRVVDFSRNWRSLSIFTLVFFLIFSLNLFNALGRVLRTILSRRRTTVPRNNLLSLIFLSTSLLLFYASMIMGNRLDIVGQILPLTGRIAFWADSLLDSLVISLALLVLYYIYSNRTIDFIPTLFVALLSGAILKGIGTLGVAIIQSMTRRISIFGAMASPIMLMMYLRIFAEILIFSSLIVDFYSSKLYSGFEPVFAKLPPPEPEQAGGSGGRSVDTGADAAEAHAGEEAPAGEGS